MGISPASLHKQGKKEEQEPTLLSLLTFSPIQNPLIGMTLLQRQVFFQYLLRFLHDQRVENLKRTEALSGKLLGPVALAGLALSKMGSYAQGQEEDEKQSRTKEEKKKPKKEKKKKPGKKKPLALHKVKISKKKKKQQEILPPAGKARPQRLILSKRPKPSMLYLTFFGKGYRQVMDIQQKLAIVIDDYARGDKKKEEKIVKEFESELKGKEYKADDLMAVLLIVIEDQIFSAQEPSVGSTKPSGTGVKIKKAVPQEIRKVAKQSANIRLASVREMLRYYFERHPEEYSHALAIALGMTSDQGGDIALLQEKLSYELASIGSFALAQKILLAIKKKKKMDEKKCLLELGYKYDKGKKLLIIGKRTCSKPLKAKEIVKLLLSRLRGKDDDD